MWQLACSPLVFALPFVLSVCQGSLCISRAFYRKFFSFFVSLAISSFWLLSHISSFRLSSGQSGLILALRTDDAARASLPSPNSLIFDASIWATSPSLLVFAVRCVFCGFSFFFFLLVMLPSEIPKLPRDPPVRGFPAIWKLLLLRDSLPRMGLHP